MIRATQRDRPRVMKDRRQLNRRFARVGSLSRWCRCWMLGLALLTASTSPALSASARAKPLPGALLFVEPTVVAFRLEFDTETHESLRREPRKYAPATATIDGRLYTNVAVHLKGAAGSFRHVDDRPALTVSFSKFVEKRRWMGLRKIHLNNSVQDYTFMNEYLASELFRAAGVPTPRVAFATVEINDRKLGLYVLKEGFTEDFLECFFARKDGNLYDGGFLRDVDQALELEEGSGVKDHSDLDALDAAARESSKARRWERFQQVLDVERFARYLAISVMLADWDGYALNRNNYRIYFDPGTGKAVFLPHGMDQMFQRSDMEWKPWFQGVVAQSFMEVPEGRRLYEERFRELFQEHFQLPRFTNTIARLAETLRPYEKNIDGRAAHLRRQIADRIRNLVEEVPQLRPPPPLETNRPAAEPTSDASKAVTLKPASWQTQPVGDARLEEGQSEGPPVLRITAQNQSTASWRSRVRLAPGRYRFEGKARCAKVQATKDDKGEGGGLRISNGPPRTHTLKGDAGWTTLHYEFEVAGGEQDVTLVCELRASRGQIDFDRNSLQVLTLNR